MFLRAEFNDAEKLDTQFMEDLKQFYEKMKEKYDILATPILITGDSKRFKGFLIKEKGTEEKKTNWEGWFTPMPEIIKENKDEESK